MLVFVVVHDSAPILVCLEILQTIAPGAAAERPTGNYNAPNHPGPAAMPRNFLEKAIQIRNQQDSCLLKADLAANKAIQTDGDFVTLHVCRRLQTFGRNERTGSRREM